MKIFVSMAFKWKSEEQVKEILEKLKKEYQKIYPEKDIEMICNYWYEWPRKGSKKLHELGNAIHLMAECDRFCLIRSKRNGKTYIPDGCKIEQHIWEDEYGEIDDIYDEGMYPLN